MDNVRQNLFVVLRISTYNFSKLDVFIIENYYCYFTCVVVVVVEMVYVTKNSLLDQKQRDMDEKIIDKITIYIIELSNKKNENILP